VKYDPDTFLQNNLSNPQSSTPILLYLRTSQTRIAISHSVFLSTAALTSNIDFAESVVDIAKDIIHTVKTSTQTTFYLTQCRLSNYFLMSSLAVIFLATIQAPEHFGIGSRDEFYLALELIRAEKPDSFIGKRLHRTLKVLSQVGHFTKQSYGTTVGATTASMASPTEMPPQMMPPAPPTFTIVETVGPMEKMEDVIDDLMNLFETPIQGIDQDLGRHDALTRIFKDLF
jgi:hypothetical protein